MRHTKPTKWSSCTLMSELLKLKQNLRTHAGVLNLAQSVINILYHYFPHSSNVFDPDTSVVFEEASALLEAGNDAKNVIINIFGDSRQTVGFGVVQLIFVRDETVKAEVYNKIDNKTLVLTTIEYKSFEFNDVLLYQFFGTSSLKDKWRVIYNFMRENKLADEEAAGSSFLRFTMGANTILC
ncbi:hypothetical protein L1987_80376 [Smallanthus sonchifolius]|uniref:Uncharacterized protein n=1 Tax=Smallanthus sonchifolius TaxID=185202 RepID=A0ACB8YN48_9ASTR|nr:hypothetical protein L1987_80376 [Smallanthus sonchifolius]